MKIFVCVKAVPDTSSNLKVGPDNLTINPQGVKYVMSPYDAIAVSKGVTIKGENDGSELFAVSVGGTQKESGAEKRLRDALALGADKGFHIVDDSNHRDSLAIAKGLADTIKAQGDFDLVLFGRQSVDSQSLAVGPMVAQLLDIPFVMDVIDMSVADGKATVKRSAEGRTETYEVPLPAAFSAQRGLSEERYAKLKDIMKAKKKPVEKVEYEFPASTLEVVEMTPPPERKAGKIVGEGVDAVPELLRLLQEEAKALAL